MLFAASFVLLCAVLVPGVGTKVNGARRWLRFGAASLQPAELVKLTLPMMVCWLALRPRETRSGTRSVPWSAVLPVLVVTPPLLMQPDLGTAAFLVLSGGLVLFLAGWPLYRFLVGGLLAAPAAVFLVALRPYQIKRITGFLATWSDMAQAPYQLKQSLIALGSGGLWGVGLGKGLQKLSFLPEANTDFVFAVVGEELGMLGTLGLIALWSGLFLVGLRLIARLPGGSFEAVLATGLLAQLVLQAALNVAVVTAMVPPKGIPHPLISYGGTSLLVSLMALGIILSLTRDAGGEPAAEG
jgi:cell division protein FtsW